MNFHVGGFLTYAIMCVLKLLQTCGDDRHLVNLVCVAAAGQIVDRSVQTLQESGRKLRSRPDAERSCSRCCLPRWTEDEGVGLTCNRRALALGSSNDRRYSSVKLQLAVDRQIRVHFLCVLGSLAGQSNRAALAGALGGEGQNSNLRVDAESLCGVCGLDGNLSQLLAALQGYVAFLVLLSG